MKNKQSNLKIIFVLLFMSGNFLKSLGLCALSFAYAYVLHAISGLFNTPIPSLLSLIFIFLNFLYILLRSFVTNRIYEYNMNYLDDIFGTDIASIKKIRLKMFYIYLFLFPLAYWIFMYIPLGANMFQHVLRFLSISCVILSEMILYLKRRSENEYIYSETSTYNNYSESSDISWVKVIFFIIIAIVYFLEVLIYHLGFLLAGTNEALFRNWL